MTLDELIFEGRVAGIGFYEIFDMTVGEVQEWIAVEAEKHTRENKRMAVIAFRHALMTAEAIMADKNTKFAVYDEFPFWSDEEIKEAKIEEYKRRLKGY